MGSSTGPFNTYNMERTKLDIQEEMNYLTERLNKRDVSLDEYYTLYSELEDEISSLDDYPCDIYNDF